MSASIFHTEWFTDPPWDRVGLWWLENYTKNVRTNPAVLEAMLANTTEFEVVPVPIAVLRALAVSAADRDQLPVAPAVDLAPVTKAVTKFAAALQAGDVDEMMKSVSKTYFDAVGRDGAQLRDDLAALVDRLPGMEVRTDRVEQASSVGAGQVVAWLNVDWNAQAERGYSRVEIFLGKSGRSGWRIESIRTV